jgi:hypothetical protein
MTVLFAVITPEISGSYGTGAYMIANQNTYQLLFRALRIF